MAEEGRDCTIGLEVGVRFGGGRRETGPAIGA